MSIRNTKFEQDILILWNEIEEQSKEIHTSGLSTEEIEEIAHLRKVIGYFSEMLKAIDPDFVPMKVLDTAKKPIENIKTSLISYIDTENFTYIKNINNDYLDTLLRDLLPFIFYKGRAGSALKTALSQYAEVIEKHSQSYIDDIKSSATETKVIAEKSRTILTSLSEEQGKINKYSDKLFNEEDGLENKVSELVSDFEEKNTEITKLHKTIFDKDGFGEQIRKHLQDGMEQNKELHSLKENSSEILDDLEEFYDDIFGIENEDGEREGGLKNEIEKRKRELDEFKIKQQQRYQELNTQIESLLPGATSAGLSHAYSEMHGKFGDEVKDYNNWFYWSLGILFIVVCLVNIAPLLYEWYVSSIEITTITPMDETTKLITFLTKFVYKLPFILPALWLVLFVSRRRNEAQRLAQEYAHKEALAKSYESYKQQIEKLSEEEQNKLLPILMENMLKAISLNPAETLDKNHKEATPVEEVLKKKEFWEHLEKVKDLIVPKSADKK